MTKTWPSQLFEAPIPIVGILIFLVIFFAKLLSTHSKTIENTPASSKSLESLKIIFLSAFSFPLNLKFFADCGNIWNVLDNETDESKIFSGISSLKDLALGTGLGIRYDFKFFLARFDFGFKTYNPAKVENQKWFKE